jgi:hypothetical protein
MRRITAMSAHGMTGAIWAATALGPRPASSPSDFGWPSRGAGSPAPIVTFPRISDVKATNGVSLVPCRPKSRSGSSGHAAIRSPLPTTAASEGIHHV